MRCLLRLLAVVCVVGTVYAPLLSHSKQAPLLVLLGYIVGVVRSLYQAFVSTL